MEVFEVADGHGGVDHGDQPADVRLPRLRDVLCQVAAQIPGQSLAQLSLYTALQQAEQNALSYTAVTSMSVCLCVCVYLRQVAAQIPGQSLAQLSLYAALQQAEQNALSYTAVTSMSVCLSVCVCVPPSGGRPDPWSESRPVVALRGTTTSRTERT